MSTPPPQIPYGAPPAGDNPYATGTPYAAGAPAAPAPAAPPGYGYPAPPPAPTPGVPQQPGPYGQPHDAPAYGYPAPQGPVCRFCGGFPAANLTVRGFQGLIIIMRFLKQPGPFCRTCGTATIRDMSAQTLVRGWWVYFGAILTPITLLQNLSAHNTIKQLPPPAPGQHGPQLDPGVPLAKRPHMLMLVLPVFSVVATLVLLALAGSSPSRNTDIPVVTMPTFNAPTFNVPTFNVPTFDIPGATASPPAGGSPKASPNPSQKVPSTVGLAKAGDCLRNDHVTGGTDDSNPDITMLPCSDPRAQYKVIAKVLGTTDGDTACKPYPATESSYYQKDNLSSFVLCLARAS